MLVRADPTKTHGALPVPGRLDPVGVPRVFMGYDDLHGTVGLIDGRVLVDRYAKVAIVQRFHPMVVELEVPGPARGRRNFDHQCLLGTQRPVAVVVADIGIATCAH